MSEITATVQLTPAMMAEAFWGMENSQQAQFFEELNRLIQHEYATKPKSYAWSLGEMQWLYLGDSLAENKPAREMLMAMAAPLYLHTLRAAPWGSV